MRRYQLIPSHAVQTLLITTTSPLPSGEVGFPYSFTFNAIGGVPPYTWLAGTLPAGLSMSSSGTISGTPTTPIVASFNVLVIDSINSQFSKNFGMTVVSAVTITTTSPLPNATQGIAYGTTMAATGGATPYTWSLLGQTGSNAWRVSRAGGVTRTPRGLGNDIFDIQVVDALGLPSAANFNLQVTTSGTVSTPTFSPVAGTYTSTQTVTISCATPSSSIYKTTDGSTPTFPITGTTTLYTGPITVSSSETVKAIGVATGLTNSAVGTAAYIINAGSTIPNLAALPSTFPSRDLTGYAALNVPAMAAGTALSDTVTGVRTVKITASGTPGAAQFVPTYSGQGLFISLPWGTNADQYTLVFQDTVGNGWLVDYQLGGSPTNFRASPSVLGSYSLGRVSFSRKGVNPHIMYVTTPSGAVRLFDTTVGVMAFVDSAAVANGSSGSWAFQ